MTAISSTSPTFAFKQVLGEGRGERWSIVKSVFKTVIEPLYGDQTDPLNKIKLNQDRKCRLMFAGDEAVGVLVYKTQPNNEHGLTNSFEIKTLCLIKPDQMSGKGYGKQLLNRVKELANDANATSIHVTVSEAAKSALAFFKKAGFQEVKVFQDKYKKGMKEYLLKLQLKESETKLQQAQAVKAEQEPPQSQSGKDVKEGEKKASAESNSDKTKTKEEHSFNQVALGAAGPFASRAFTADILKHALSQKVPFNLEGNLTEKLAKEATKLFQSDRKAFYRAEDKDSDGGRKTFYGLTQGDKESARDKEKAAMETTSRKRKAEDELPNYRQGAGAGSGSGSSYKIQKTGRMQDVSRGSGPNPGLIPLKEPYFSQIREGKKTVEGRIDNHPFNLLREKQTVTFKNGPRTVDCEITKIVRYRTFKEMLEKETVAACLPGTKTIDDGVKIYNDIPTYSAKAARFGVLAIRIKKI